MDNFRTNISYDAFMNIEPSTSHSCGGRKIRWKFKLKPKIYSLKLITL